MRNAQRRSPAHDSNCSRTNSSTSNGRGVMVRLVCWNIAKRSEPWRELVEMARQGEADVALLQEARNPPGEPAHLVRHTTTQRRLRFSGKSPRLRGTGSIGTRSAWRGGRTQSRRRGSRPRVGTGPLPCRAMRVLIPTRNRARAREWIAGMGTGDSGFGSAGAGSPRNGPSLGNRLANPSAKSSRSRNRNCVIWTSSGSRPPSFQAGPWPCPRRKSF